MKPLFQECCGFQLLGNQFHPSVETDILRLDLIHPVVSGNKWFKLKKYIKAAKREAKTVLLTFGGAYSNHILATAATAQVSGLKSIGIIRGEEPESLPQTLLAAKSFGMDLYFISREEYRQKIISPFVYSAYDAATIYVVPEGGYGELGAIGAEDILRKNNAYGHTHILAAVGTGTTLAGLIGSAARHQKIVGIPVLKNAFSLRQEIKNLLPQARHVPFELMEDYHFGGYAKYNDGLLQFMNSFYKRFHIPTDFVYTGKAFYAAHDLIGKNYFPSGSRLLLVHTGGLQGNASLKKGALIFD